MLTDQSLASSSSSGPHVADAPVHRSSSLLSLAKEGGEEMNEAEGVKEERCGVEREAASGVKERQSFDSLSPSGEKIKCANAVEMDEC